MNPSDPPNPQAPAPSAPRRGALSTLSAVATATLVFLVFVAYGKLSPATYVATSQIVLRPLGGKPLSLSDPNPVERVRRATLDPEALTQVAAVLGLGKGAAGQRAAEEALRGRVDVSSPTVGVFDVSVRASTAQATQRIANLLARHAASRASRLLGPAVDAGAAREAARAKGAADLAQLMAAHPELSPSPVVAPVPPKDDPSSDAETSALRAERDQLAGKLAKMPSASDSSDNPFGEQAAAQQAEATRLRRRLAEIDQKLVTRKRAEKKTEQVKPIAPEVEREWKRLLAEVADPPVAAAPRSEPSFAVMQREATLPTAPIKPNRRMVALVGALAAILSGALMGVWQSRRTRQRTARRPMATVRIPREPSPQVGSEPPPQLGSEPPPQLGSEPPPQLGSDPPPQLGSDPPPQLGSDPPPPQPDARNASSNPPRRESDPVPVHAIATINAAPVAPGASPAADGAPPAVPKHDRVPKGTQIGLGASTLNVPELRADPLGKTAVAAPVDPLDKTAVAPAVDPLDKTAVAASAEPFPPTPSTRKGTGTQGSTLDSPPPDAPRANVALARTDVAVANPDEIEVTRPEEMRQRAGFERDESWTGPSRAHRRSASARRTTQVLGSPIAPVVQQGEQNASPHVSTPSAQPPPQRSSTSPTGYSYVSDRPEARPAATPPYYYPPTGNEARRTGANQTTPRPPTMSHSAPAPSQRSRVAPEPVRRGWSPDPSVDLTLRRQLSDQIVPLAVERCFVLGVVAVPDAQQHKARVTAELAMALAEPRRPRVLLMEADFARPAVHRIMQLEMPTSRGLSQQLRTRGQNPNDAWTVLELSPTLHVIAEGIVRLPGLLLTAQFEDGLRSLRDHYDVIVLHGPDTSAEVDCRALGGLVDGVICVAPQAGSPDLARAGEAFPEARFSAAVGV